MRFPLLLLLLAGLTPPAHSQPKYASAWPDTVSWAWNADPSGGNGQIQGWPITFGLEQMCGRQAFAWLPTSFE